MFNQANLKFHRFLNVVLVVVLLWMSGVVYVSAHGGDGLLIHACVNSRSGAVRIVGANTTCDARETSLDWSIQGPAGPQGPAGAGIDSDNTYFVEVTRSLEPTQGGELIVSCNDSNDILLSGGFDGTHQVVVEVRRSRPLGYQQWLVHAINRDFTTQGTFTAVALCLRVD